MPALAPSMYTASPAVPRTSKLPGEPAPASAAPEDVTRMSTRLTVAARPTLTSKLAVATLQPDRETVNACRPGNRSSTNAGVRPRYEPSSHTSAPAGSVVIYAPPCGGSVAEGAGLVGIADCTSAAPEIGDASTAAPIKIAARHREYATKNIRMCAFSQLQSTRPGQMQRVSRGRRGLVVEQALAVTSSPIVALVGRPNVGKSALFNRLLGRRLAIVEATPGVTRDRLYAPIEWLGRRFTVVDTGGIETGSVDDLMAQTRAQAELAIREADVVLFVVDAQAGVQAGDDDVAGLLRPQGEKVLLVANKVESPNSAANIYEFCTLGFDVPMPVSAVHGLQSGDLLDAIVAKLPAEKIAPDDDDGIVRLAIIGQPNVGKSSLVNALLGQKRAIVSETPGTTRDATDTEMERDGRRFVIIDTAGIRRHVNQGPALDYYSSLRAVAAIGRCDVALLLIDAQVGATAQDRRIAGLATDEGKAFAIMVNKWDLVDAAAFDRAEVEAALRADFSFAPYVALLFGSALTKRGVHKVWDTV